jgi:hypothetical protein
MATTLPTTSATGTPAQTTTQDPQSTTSQDTSLQPVVTGSALNAGGGATLQNHQVTTVPLPTVSATSTTAPPLVHNAHSSFSSAISIIFFIAAIVLVAMFLRASKSTTN